MTDWHQLDQPELIKTLDSRADGLTSAEVAARLSQVGPNELRQQFARSPWLILWQQLKGALVILLIGAALVSWLLGEYIDSLAIMVIVLLNACLGFVQDFRAEKAMLALRQMAVPEAKVRRDKHLQQISSRELVPGDVILVEAGNFVPADGRILVGFNLTVEEAALTGESASVLKSAGALVASNAPLGDRINMVFMGTVVTGGHAEVMVTDTGMRSELGKVAHSLQTVAAEPTPLQRRLGKLGRTLALVAIVIVAVVFLLGLLRGEQPQQMLMTALSLAVAIVPEGLPAVATVSLALGARRMIRRAALVRQLPAVETLGSVTVICSDKTGTLTQNKMTVDTLEIAGRQIRPSELTNDELLRTDPALATLLAIAGLCNDVEIEYEENQIQLVGEATEKALTLVAAEHGLAKRELMPWLPRVNELPFDSQRKRMTTIHRVEASPDPPAGLKWLSDQPGALVGLTKGAVDQILEVADWLWVDGSREPMSEEARARILSANEALAGRGMRILGFAYQLLTSENEKNCEQGLTFVGLAALIDPPRAEVPAAVERCQQAGIRTIMITGDHPLTAVNIAQQLRIASDARVLTGSELASMDVDDLTPVVDDVSVYARVAPDDKLHIVQALQQNGEVVAMTGDGVNDAPALKQAHIGVAMGKTGTDVAKEASSMVLLDDNFVTIVNAVEEGRIVYDNIRKFVKYTMTSNAGEITTMLLGPLLGMPLPLLPLQILWINLVTDGLPGLALAAEPAERNTMRRPPYSPSAGIFGRSMILAIFSVGLLMGVTSLCGGFLYWRAGAEENHWRTLVFTVLTLSQMGNALAIRSERDTLWRIGLWSNRPLLAAIGLTAGLQLLVVYWPPLQRVFGTVSLTLSELGLCLAFSSIVLVALEAFKWFSHGGSDTSATIQAQTSSSDRAGSQ